MTFLKHNAFWFVSIFMIVLALFFFSTNQSVKKELSFIEKAVYIASSPVEVGFYEGKNWITNIYHSYIEVKDAKETALKLTNENLELKSKISLLESTVTENARLRKLLDLKEKSAVQLASCEIMQADPSFVYKNIRINLGSKTGLTQGMGVISAEGVVGVIMRVYQGYSDVLLLTDPNSNLDVVVARNRRRGILQGGLSHLMQFKYFERGSNLLIGDEIVTSGLTGSFPSGIPVGKVINIKPGQDNVTQIVEVEPSVDFSDLAEALVLLTPNREMETIRKVGGIEWIQKLVESNTGKNGG